MSFASDLQLSKKAQPIQDAVYQSLWNPSKITRFEKDDEMILDIKYHIDVVITLQNKSTILGQEKALRHKYSSFNTFTIEYYQNRFTKELGEFFNLGAQFYFHGYLNESETELEKWVVIKIFDFILYLRELNSTKLQQYLRSTGNSNATFFMVNYKKIPPRFIYESYNIQL